MSAISTGARDLKIDLVHNGVDSQADLKIGFLSMQISTENMYCPKSPFFSAGVN